MAAAANENFKQKLLPAGSLSDLTPNFPITLVDGNAHFLRIFSFLNLSTLKYILNGFF